MSDKKYGVVQIDELEPFPIESLPADSHGRDGTWRPVRRRLDVSSFGVNAYTAEEAGQCVVPEHRDSQEELYAVVSGRASFALEGKEHDAPAGTLVHCPPETLRTAVATVPGTTVLAVGATPGKAYQPSGWEWAFTGFAKLAQGDEEGARGELEAGIAAYPEAWQGPYNYACLEAGLGNDQAALERLEGAARLDPESVAKWAPEDSDFAALKDDPRFQAIIAQAGRRQV